MKDSPDSGPLEPAKGAMISYSKIINKSVLTDHREPSKTEGVKMVVRESRRRRKKGYGQERQRLRSTKIRGTMNNFHISMTGLDINTGHPFLGLLGQFGPHGLIFHWPGGPS